jgi:hypothetical protein
MGSAHYTDERIRLLCREYLVDFNQVRALMRAGWTEVTANKNGWKIFQRPDVIMYLKELMDERNKKVDLTADTVLEELRRLALSNIADYYKWSDKKQKYVLKPLSDLTREQTAAIAKYEPGEGYTLYNKDGALDKLAKYFKLYSEVDAVVTNFVMMPELKLNGVPMEFNIGKPAPQRNKPTK